MQRWELQGRDPKTGHFTQGDVFAARHPPGMSSVRPYGWRVRVRWHGRYVEGGYWKDFEEARQALAVLRARLARGDDLRPSVVVSQE
jgi:hypothetical protein